jgi:hypothetical protein
VVGVGSGASLDLARALAMSAKATGPATTGGGGGPRLILVPATHVAVMVSGGAAASASAAAASADAASPSESVPCPPLVLDGEEATLLPCFDKGIEAANLTVVQLDASDMVGCASTSTLAAASLVLDRMVRQLAARRSHQSRSDDDRDDDDDDDEEESRHLRELLDRLLRAAAAASEEEASPSSGADGGTASSSAAPQQPPPLLWDSLFDVGLTCLNFTRRNDGSPPHRPVPLALAASLGAVAPQSIPELMAATVPYLLEQLVDGGGGDGDSGSVSVDSRRRIERLLLEGGPAPAPVDPVPPLDEYLEMLETNRTLTRCRDDDALLRRIIRDMVRDERK